VFEGCAVALLCGHECHGLEQSSAVLSA
jgi:hypothetical protein